MVSTTCIRLEVNSMKQTDFLFLQLYISFTNTNILFNFKTLCVLKKIHVIHLQIFFLSKWKFTSVNFELMNWSTALHSNILCWQMLPTLLFVLLLKQLSTFQLTSSSHLQTSSSFTPQIGNKSLTWLRLWLTGTSEE